MEQVAAIVTTSLAQRATAHSELEAGLLATKQRRVKIQGDKRTALLAQSFAYMWAPMAPVRMRGRLGTLVRKLQRAVRVQAHRRLGGLVATDLRTLLWAARLSSSCLASCSLLMVSYRASVFAYRRHNLRKSIISVEELWTSRWLCYHHTRKRSGGLALPMVASAVVTASVASLSSRMSTLLFLLVHHSRRISFGASPTSCATSTAPACAWGFLQPLQGQAIFKETVSMVLRDIARSGTVYPFLEPMIDGTRSTIMSMDTALWERW